MSGCTCRKHATDPNCNVHGFVTEEQFESLVQSTKIGKKEYWRIHRWLNYHGNKTGECCLCGKHGKTEWSLIDGYAHARDFKNYEEICVPCHRKKDRLSHLKDQRRAVELSERNKPQTIVTQVVEDLREREAFGTRTYGVPLLADATKYDALQEAYEEALDLCVYLKLELVRRG